MKPELTWPHPESKSIDHIIAINNGGPHTLSNLQAAHIRCNAIKSDRVVQALTS